MIKIRLNTDFRLYKKPPMFLTNNPIYVTSEDQSGLSLEISFNTVPKQLIDTKKMLKDALKINNIKFCDGFKIYNERLLMELYDGRNQNDPILVEPYLDGAEYAFLTSAPRSGFWRVAFIYTFDVKYKDFIYKVEILDDKDFKNENIIFSSVGIEYPQFKFFRINPLDKVIDKQPVAPTPSN